MRGTEWRENWKGVMRVIRRRQKNFGRENSAEDDFAAVENVLTRCLSSAAKRRQHPFFQMVGPLPLDFFLYFFIFLFFFLCYVLDF